MNKIARIATVISLMIVSLSAYSQPKTAVLNLSDADIGVLINTVSQATGKNFIIDPRVKAKVTVISSKSMQEDELYEVFLSILDVHGFAAIPSGDIIKIVPDVNGKQGAIPTDVDTNEEGKDQLITQVIELDNVSANQLVPILRPLVPQQAHMAAYMPTNVLVVSDRASNIQRLMRVIRKMDRAEQAEIEFIQLQNASATEVVRIVTALIQQEQRESAGFSKPSVTADERTNSVLLGGDKTNRQRIKRIIRQLDGKLESSGNTKVIFLKYAVAKDLVAILQGVSNKAVAEQQGGKAPAGGGAKSQVDIQADEVNNALVITAQPSILQELENVIRQLDIPRAQVMIEAIIAEVSTDLASQLGAQFLFNGISDDEQGPIGSGLFPNLAGPLIPSGGGIDSGSSSVSNAQAAASLLGEGFTLGVGNTTSDGSQFVFLLRALQGDSATNILSTPTLVTLDNVEAEMVFGQNVPFVTGSFSNTGGGGNVQNPFQTIERQDVGLTLKIKPQINEGDAIKLEIEQEVSSIATSAVAASDVITNKRQIKTQVMVEDGQTIVLGGLIEDEFRDTQQKVPLLGSIPLLGRLFSYTTTQKTKRNLMVFIRPVILKDSISSHYFTSQKYNLIRARQAESDVKKRGLIRDSAGELPEIEVLFTPLPPSARAPSDNNTQVQ